VIPWSPLARGRLARPWQAETPRTKTDPYVKVLFAAAEESDRKVVEQVVAIAEARGVPRAQVAIAWLAQKSVVTAPIIGASKLQHLDDAAAALELKLTAEEIAQLEAPYVPHRVAGHS
jgi:1-deoxyxylulose-5-phosphate synthase